MVDSLGDHFHECLIGNLRQARHNKITTEFRYMFAYAGISSEYEPSLGLLDKNIRPDLVAHNLSFGAFGDIPEESSKNIYFDISVTHPINQPSLNNNKNIDKPESAAKTRYSEKIRKFKEVI